MDRHSADILLIDQIMKKHLSGSSFLHTIHQHEINVHLLGSTPALAGLDAARPEAHVFARPTAAEEPLASLREPGSPVETRDPC